MDQSLARTEWERLRRAFEQALDLQPEQRQAWLDDALADAPTLRAEAEQMLAQLGHGDSVTERVADSRRSAEPRSGQWVGSQRLQQRIGEGGMGEIWSAERVIGDDRQQVAVKLLSFGSGQSFSRRLAAERAVLARLNHPNICTLLDAGVDTMGRPYLVLELVDGEPLSQWCYAQRPDLDARLGLLLEVCDAVAYAHAQLVVHRDLKPANVLIGASGRVKLLDFGIAKMLDQSADPSGATQMLTPAYASPEQVRALPVTTATDIYALGVLLYELICGQLPQRLDGLAQDVLIDCLLNPRFPKPSQRLASAGQRRQARRVADGLDAVVAKAMHPEPERRYLSVQAMAEDLRCWLDGRPVQARPDHWSYRLRCFIRRNALASAALALLIVFGTGFSVALWQRYQAERTALVSAERERALSNQISDFLVELFASADPDSTDPERVDLQTLLARGTDSLLDGSIDDAELAAGLGARIAQVYANLGLYAEAERVLQAVQPEAQTTISAARRAALADVGALIRYGAGDMAEAETLLRDALRLHGDAPSVARGRSLYQLAVVLRDRAEYAEAEQLLAEAALVQQQLEPDALIRTRAQQAALAWLQGDLNRAERRYDEALSEGRRHLSPEHPDLARALSGLSLLAHRRNQFAAAADFGEQALAIQQAAFGAEHPICAETLGNLGALYMDAGDRSLAEARLRAALAIQQPRRDELGPALSNTQNNLGLLAYRGGDPAQARNWFEQALVSATLAYGEQHPQVAAIVDNLGLSLKALGELPAAEEHFQRALEVRRKVLGSEHPHLAYSHHHLGELALQSGDLDAAAVHLDRALQIRLAVLGEGHPLSATSTLAWARLLTARGESEQAQAQLVQALAWLRDAEGTHGAEIAEAATELAALQAAAGDDPNAALAQARAESAQLSAAQRERLSARWAAIEAR